MKHRILSMVCMLGTLVTVSSNPVWAQSNVTSGIAIVVTVSTRAVTTGDLLCATAGGFDLCQTQADPSLFGVVNLNPAALINNSELNNGVPVETSGVVMVKVSTANGAIPKGAYVTSSISPGVAVLAVENGYVLGSAQESFDGVGADNNGMIPVALNIHLEAGLSSARSNLIAVLTRGVQSPVFAPLDSLRYLLAAAMILLSFVLGFVYFGRTAGKGVEAVGRNPLARNQIQMNVVMQLAVTLVVVLIGLFVSYLILIL